MHIVPVNPQLHTFRSPEFESVAQETIKFMDRTPIHPLPPKGNFAGVGVYALYYRGNFGPYIQIAGLNKDNCKLPIYVGKAVPPGWRAARYSQGTKIRALQDRLLEHAGSIIKSHNLKIVDFCCRFVILDGIEADLISTLEASLIRRHKPLWNAVVDGFGNHDPGSGRRNQARSEWDVLHSGRSWAKKLTGKPPNKKDILKKLELLK